MVTLPDVLRKKYLYHYSKFNATGSAFEDLLERYARWVLGKDSKSARKNQLAKGVPETLSLEVLMDHENLDVVNETCHIQMRRGVGVWLLRFAHKINGSQQIWIVTQARLQAQLDGALTLEHGAWQVHGTHTPPIPIGNTPRVLKNLMDSKQGLLAERQIYPRPITLESEDVHDFVAHQFFAPDRTWPLVAVSAHLKPKSKSSPYRISPDKLFENLRSQAIIVQLPDVSATLAWKKALESRTQESFANCFDGAVRLYMPVRADAYKPRSSDWHKHSRLWLASQVYGSHKDALNYLSASISRQITLRRLPANLLDCIERFDASQRILEMQQTFKAVNDASRVSITPEEEQQLKNNLEEIERQFIKTEQEKKQFQEKYDEIFEENTLMTGLLEEASEKQKSLEDELEQIREELRAECVKTLALEYQMDAQQASSESIVLSRDRANLILSQFQHDRSASSISLEQGLELLVALCPDRVIVLDSALKSARESHNFEKPLKAFELMSTLIGGYLDDLREGKGTTQAKERFSDTVYAAHEQKSARGNRRAKELRTFEYRDKTAIFWKHLKIGVGKNTHDGWRLHFEYDSELDRIVIGHCGKHLDHH